ncbi:DUF1624 domain-containing protein [Alteromonas sediminis]|uniref:DUF1624 domain-containing protein n=1 Tax=Alteromonas sediminis TaxID=2259342 RepID=A0A3N5YBX9_9ALTE|nr:heparan-alpha-glucosaminide N-acetyltransferase domain-containing protein [Alteromonas sediminis]RPJ66645.1 DUF1624 domain-containing protein [Alteromonas sediminis]
MSKLSQDRMLAIDALRGITITAMILVNNPGSWQYVYPPLLHAEWHGWTPTDLIFPFFVFIVGLSMSLSVPKQLAKGQPNSAILKQGLIRCTKLILLGLFLAVFYYNTFDPNYNWWTDRIVEIRLPGVLQRIGIVFLLTLMLMLWLNNRGRIIAFGALMLGYWASMQWAVYYDAQGNAYSGLFDFGNSFAAWLDSVVFGSAHVYYPKATPFPFDPEGIFSTLPAVATCLSGVFAGQWLASNASLSRKTLMLALVGIAGYLAGEFLSFVVPINKALWTPSYVLMSSGLACLSLALCLFLIDMKGFRKWTAPFVVFGANSIAFFMFAGVLARILIMIPVGQTSFQGWLYASALQPVFGNYNGSLAFALLFLLVSYLVMFGMYKRGIIWKV